MKLSKLHKHAFSAQTVKIKKPELPKFQSDEETGLNGFLRDFIDKEDLCNFNHTPDVQTTVDNYIPFSDFIASENPRILDYLFKEEMGCGAFSRVFRVVYLEDDEELAAKVYDCQKLYKEDFNGNYPTLECLRNEIDILSSVSHRYIITMVESLQDENTNSFIIIFPLARNGSLSGLLEKKLLSKHQIKICFHQMAVALHQLHTQNIVHRDIKPENILVFTYQYFALSDFSASCQLEHEGAMLVDTKGSPAFLSPEECSGKSFNPKAADVWAYGVSFYKSYFGEFPFDIGVASGLPMANSIMVVTEKLSNNDLSFPEETDPLIISFFSSVLNKDPTKRPSFSHIQNHKIFDDVRDIDRAFAEEELTILRNDV